MTHTGMRITVDLDCTSEDLFELAKKMAEKEKNIRWGEDCRISTWRVSSHVSIDINLDQERAREKGLME